MNFKKALYWHNGLFLKPHHFQYLQMYSENSFALNLELMNIDNWGLVELEYDETKLNNYEIYIKKLVCIFKDKTIIQYPENSVILSRDFSNQIKQRSILKCFLGIKKLTQLETNITELDDFSELNKISTRYVFDKNKIESHNNLFEENDKADMFFLSNYVKILFENEIDGLLDYEIIPLFEIKNQDSKLFISNKYYAPTLNIFTNQYLEKTINDIYDYMFSHINSLEEYKIPFDYQNNNYMVSKRLSILEAIIEYVPIIKTYTEKNNIHPSHIYNTLIKLACKLSVYTNKISLGVDSDVLLKKYDHNDLYLVFYKIKELIFNLFSDLDFGPDRIINFIYQNGIHIAKNIPKEYFNEDYKFYISIEGSNIKQFIQNIELLKISSSRNISQIVAYSILGLNFNKLDTPPVGLPKKKNCIYIELLEDNLKEWQDIKYVQDISLVHDGITEEYELNLLVIEK